MATWLGVMAIVAIGAFVLGTRVDNISVLLGGSQNKGLPANLDYKSVEEVYDKLREKYDGKLDAAKLLEGAKKGLLKPQATLTQFTLQMMKPKNL